MTRVSISASPAGILTFVMLKILDAEHALSWDKVIMEGRKVVRPGEKSKNPGIELEADRIQNLVDADRISFVRRAQRLPNAAAVSLARVVVSTIRIRTTRGLRKAAKRDGIVDWPAASVLSYLNRSSMSWGTTSLDGLSQSFSKFCSQFFAHGRAM